MKKLAKQAILSVAGSTIRYRRSLQYWEKYEIITKLVYFDDKSFYVEQKFVSLKDNFTSAVAYVKVSVRKISPLEILKQLENLPEEELKMDCPDYIRSWIDFNDKSSNSLKADKKN
ncbi:unnamed protein product [Dimorphilus gyrociliatus]|uniref:Protein THEM6 n=1 Tax=Dimorphilus gyrociliatus TaxID=2664684 RepID=A0A7I8VQZ8_9ANNE|nr:unnamed protein product [Dimorphilus gyrociliatus]